MGEKTVNVRIRFPESLKDRVQTFATADRRSLNAEVLTLLEEAMNAREEDRRQAPRLLCAEPPAEYGKPTTPPPAAAP